MRAPRHAQGRNVAPAARGDTGAEAPVRARAAQEAEPRGRARLAARVRADAAPLRAVDARGGVGGKARAAHRVVALARLFGAARARKMARRAAEAAVRCAAPRSRGRLAARPSARGLARPLRRGGGDAHTNRAGRRAPPPVPSGRRGAGLCSKVL
ncbi:hypothetical protein M885DRAFT_530583 [Pelagophyceae sp. CCMP2097]|nr:hypothetical protein M885DRAFT_530583 [Pelagophyceae sp. CCMP2097]